MSTKKYKIVRMPREAYDDLIRKKIQMENNLKNILGKKKNIPFTRVVRVVAKQPIYLDDFELSKMIKMRGLKKCNLY